MPLTLAGEATARFIRQCLTSGAEIDHEILRPAAPFVILLQRRSVLLSSTVAPPDQYVGESALVAELMSQLAAAAIEAQDIALAQLVNWSRQAWSARRYDIFDTGRALPPSLMHQLSELLRTTPSPVMLQAAGTVLLRALAEELRRCAEEHVKLDRHVGPELFMRPVSTFLESLEAGAAAGQGLLDLTPEERVAQALAALGGTAASNDGQTGAKWRRLVGAATDIADRAARILELAGEFRWRSIQVPDLQRLDCSELAPELLPVLEAALHPDPAPDAPRDSQGESLLAALAAEALALAEPQDRHQIAVVARLAGLDPRILEPALAPLERLRARTEELLRDAGDTGAETLGPLGALVTDALARGDVEEAGQGVELLAEARTELDVARKLERLRADLGQLSAPDDAAALDLRTADLHFANGDTEAAAEYVRRAEARLAGGAVAGDGGEPSPAARTETQVKVAETPPGLPLGPHPQESDAHASAGSVVIGTTGTAPQGDGPVTAILEGCRPGATPESLALGLSALQRLGVEGSYAEVSRVARQLTYVAPGAAADLLEAAVDRFPPVARPAMWQLQEQALRLDGRSSRAEEVFHRGHPPLPPPDLLSARPLETSPPLVPRLSSLTGSVVGNASLAEAARAVAENDASAAAAAFTAAGRAGVKTALGLAVGWHVLAGDPAAALGVYRELASRQYLNAAAVWNIACAYAFIGADRLAVDSLQVMTRVLPGRPAQAQKEAADRYCARVGLLSPFVDAVVRREQATTVAGEQTRESVAKQMYEGGDVDGAARELQALLRDNPSSPGAFLMLRICRDLGDLPRAEAVVRHIAEARGALTWRHHIELARTALDRRCADYVVARRELHRARELNATHTWIGPLEQRLRDLATTVPHTGVTPADDASATDARPATAPGAGESELAHEGRTSPYDGMSLNDVVAGLRSGTLPAPRGAALGDLLDKAVASHDDYLVRDVAFWLMDGGNPTEAVHLLERCLTWAAPEKIPRVLLIRDRAALAAGIPPAGLRPPSAPRLADSGLSMPGRRLHLEVRRGQITGPPATQPAIRAAQQPLPGASPDDIADAWARAARLHPVALSNALAKLVDAGRAEEALRLHDELADTRWLGAGAAWNLGCAYAATGRLEAAASAFEYHARVSSRRLDSGQAADLQILFAAVGRPVPTSAGRSYEPPVRHAVPPSGTVVTVPAYPSGAGESAVPPQIPLAQTNASSRLSQALEAAESSAARLIAQCRSEPSGHNFRLAADAARRAMRAGGSADAGRYVATMRELFTYQPDPQPDTAAAMAMVLETAERYENAWELLTEWIDRTRANAELIAPAVRVARVLGRAEQLRGLLQPYDEPGAGFELHLNMAKLAQLLKRDDELVRHADLALQLNPNCAEAAGLLRNSVSGLPRRDPKQTVSLRQRIAAAHTTRQQAVELLETEYGPTLAALRVQALARFRPSVSRRTLERRLGSRHREEATALLAAAEEEDWELASDHARNLLDAQPRSALLAKVTADCLIEARRDDEVRTVASLVGSDADYREILVRLACARRDHAELGRLMSGVRVWHPDRTALLAHAGVLAEEDMGDSPAEAAQLLLIHARLQPRSEVLAALAALLAHRADRNELVDEAIELLRRGEAPPLDVLVDSALAAQVPEAINRIAPPIDAGQLQRIVDHLAADRVRLVGFLRASAGRTGTTAAHQVEKRARTRLLGRFYAEDGMLALAMKAYQEAREAGADHGEILLELTGLCAEWGADEPAEVAAHLLAGGEAGAPWTEGEVTPEAAELLESLRGYRAERRGQDLTRELARVGEALGAGANGPDVPLCRRMGQSWQRQATLILSANGRGDAPTAQPGTPDQDVDAAIREGDARAWAFASSALREASLQVQEFLQRLWAATGRERLRGDAAAHGPLSWRQHLATRLEGGPVELRLQLRAGSDALSGVTVRVQGTDIVEVVGRMEPGAVASLFLLVPIDDNRLCVEAQGILPDQSTGRAKDCPVKVSAITRQEALVSRFRPGEPVNAEMFVGRAGEMDRLRSTFGAAWRESVPPLSMTGSRRAGKTSLIRQITRLWGGTPEALLPPDRWRIPRVFPVLLDGQSVHPDSDSLLTWIAKEVRDRVEEHYEPEIPDLGFPEGPHAVEFRRWWRAVRRAVWPEEKVGLLLVVDELQELLRRYGDREELSRALGDIRRLRQDGTLALLLSGSCTTAQLREWLAGTLSRQDFQSPLRLGPLDRQATLQAVHQGFAGTGVDVLTSAAELVFQYTAGHPHHVHMVGRGLCELLETRDRTVVDDALVDEAFAWVTQQEEAVMGLLDLETQAEDSLELLFRIGQELDTDADEDTVRDALIEDAHRSRLDDYLDYGLLVRAGTNLAWTNSVVESWLERRNAPWDDGSTVVHAHEKELRPQYLVTRRYEGSPTNACEVQLAKSRDVTYIAKQYRDAADGTLQFVHQLLDVHAPTAQGMPVQWKRNGSWLIHRKIAGKSLALQLRGDSPLEAWEAVRLVIDACYTVAQVWDSCQMSHGDIRPGNLIVADGRQESKLYVVGWGHGGVHVAHETRPLLPAARSVYYTDATREGRVPGPADDAFALALVLYQLLHPKQRLPWDGTNEADGEYRLELDHVPQRVRPILTVALGYAGQRYRSAGELVEALRWAPPDETVAAPERAPGLAAIVNVNASNASSNTTSNQVNNPSEVQVGSGNIEISAPVTGSAVGENIDNSNNSSSYASNTAATEGGEDFATLVARLRAELANVRQELAPGDARDVDASVDGLAEEAASDEPNPGRVRRLAGLARGILETVGGAAAAIAVVQAITNGFGA
ncbi:hypothetical protein AB0D99_21200 [Streptomyces sp. NPDC047971]|uniref:hypothetical protein n=1 Tax=Streptomyces sp. NPDC047971 TaxID=3154499 RepID=UPI0033CB2F56